MEFPSWGRSARAWLVTVPPLATPSPVPCKFSSYHDLVWEDDSTRKWNLRLVDRSIAIDGLVSMAIETVAMGPQVQDKQLAVVLPWAKYDLDGEALVGTAKGM